MPFTLPPLPFAKNALAPHISERTMGFHYDKHHAGYVKKLNNQIEGTDYANMALEDIIRKADASGDSGIFNNAAQIWNHTFFWDSLSPNGGTEPDAPLSEAIKTSFGSFDDFKKAFVEAGKCQFGSGWVWLVSNAGKLSITTTENALTPVLDDSIPLLTCDVWEHAYYLDYQNRRGDFLQAFVDELANWTFAEQQFQLNGQKDYWSLVEERSA